MSDTKRLTTAVVIPCHNYGRFLSDAINSAIDQSRPVDEIVVVDDSSDDDTEAVVRKWQGFLRPEFDGLLKYVSIDERHTWTARRSGFAETTADVVCFLDADDTLAPDYFRKGVAEFEANPHVGIVYSDMQEFGDGSKLHSYPPTGAVTKHHLEMGNQLHAGSLVSRKALVMSGAFDAYPPTNFNADWYLWRQVTDAGFRSAKSGSLYNYRIHGASQTRTEAKHSHYEGANLQNAAVTVVVLMDDEDVADTKELGDWVYDQTWENVEYLFVGATADEMAADMGGKEGLAQTYLPGYDPDTVYAEVARRVVTPFAFFLNAKELPDERAIERALKGLTPFAAWAGTPSGNTLVSRWALFEYALQQYDAARLATEATVVAMPSFVLTD